MKKLLIIFPVFLLFSCNTTITESYSFAENRWEVDDVKIFEFEIKDDSESATITLEFLHIYEPQYNIVPIIAEITGPDGQKEQLVFDLQLKDEQGKYASDCLGDICDYSYILKDNAPVKRGKYKIAVANQFPAPYLPNVISLGIKVKAGN